MWVVPVLLVLLPGAVCAQTAEEPTNPEPQTIRATVTVVAAAPVETKERAGLRHIVEERTVVSLPLNGRNFMALTSLAPGVALPPGSMLPRINGGRPRTN